MKRYGRSLGQLRLTSELISSLESGLQANNNHDCACSSRSPIPGQPVNPEME